MTLKKQYKRLRFQARNFIYSFNSRTINCWAIMHSIALYIAVLLSCAVAKTIHRPTKECDPSVCKLPNCFCSGTEIPNKLEAKQIPQIVMLTFDDAINEQVYSFYTSLFNGEFKNPNGCEIKSTFFVSHEWTDYQMLQTLYHERHEIADHTISHREPVSWWKNATAKQWRQEILGQREILRKFGNVAVEDVRGFRAPFLQGGGDKEFGVLHDNKFLYESSMPAYLEKHRDPPMWPYTLDYSTTEECTIPPCPKASFPGLWEVPLIDYNGLNGALCAMVDACEPKPNTHEEATQLIYSNFKRHYNSNRAPFPMFMHAAWFINHPERLEGVKAFIREVLSLKDVYFVTVTQAIRWIQSPTTLNKIEDFKPWKCDSPPPPKACTKANENICYYPPEGSLQEHYLHMCTRPCPKHYPWVGNPDGN